MFPLQIILIDKDNQNMNRKTIILLYKISQVCGRTTFTTN